MCVYDSLIPAVHPTPVKITAGADAHRLRTKAFARILLYVEESLSVEFATTEQ